MDRSNLPFARWVILQTLYNARPIGTAEGLVLSVLQSAGVGEVTPLQVRQELDYLADRKVIEISDRHTGTWRAKINRYGVDVVEYSVECLPGIARPEKYW